MSATRTTLTLFGGLVCGVVGTTIYAGCVDWRIVSRRLAAVRAAKADLQGKGLDADTVRAELIKRKDEFMDIGCLISRIAHEIVVIKIDEIIGE
jgi:hypothetical protein